MKAKQLFLAMAVLLAAGGLWFAWSSWRMNTFHPSSMEDVSEKPLDRPASGQELRPPGPSKGIGSDVPGGEPESRPKLQPPSPNRLFLDFTPEERVQFARQGHGPGG